MEIWKEVVGYEGYYEISNLGNLRSIDRYIEKSNGVIQYVKGKYIPGNLTSDGYIRVKLNKNGITKSTGIHRLVAESFIEKPISEEYLEVNHIDFNRTNNKFDNLEWSTHRQNIDHSCNNGNYKGKNGDKNGRAVYSDEDALNIRKLYEEGNTVMDIVKIYYPQLSNNIQRKNKWSRIKEIIVRKTFNHI